MGICPHGSKQLSSSNFLSTVVVFHRKGQTGETKIFCKCFDLDKRLMLHFQSSSNLGYCMKLFLCVFCSWFFMEYLLTLEALYLFVGQTEFHMGLYSEPWEANDSLVIYHYTCLQCLLL